LSRVVPIEKDFYFSPENVEDIFKMEVEEFVDRIKPGETFCVRITRRGMKGIFSSQEMARKVGSFIWQKLEERGIKPKVDLENPDKMIIFETLGNWCGVGVISKELREKHYYLKI
jgi:tRNA(Ser,Leu) C12 N-acetylase TAN1